jgi:hypothetical protein
MTQFPLQGGVELVANGPRELPPGGRLDAALRSARLAEAAQFEALMNIRDAATLRLQVLKDDLEPVVKARREADSFIDLALVPGSPPRLWIDMVSYVLMAPDPRTYRFCQDTTGGQKVLFETAERAEMVDRITVYIAHRVIDRQRHLVVPASETWLAARRAPGTAALLLAWLSGFSLGALAFFLVAAWLDKLP